MITLNTSIGELLKKMWLDEGQWYRVEVCIKKIPDGMGGIELLIDGMKVREAIEPKGDPDD